jgi:putative redox protein
MSFIADSGAGQSLAMDASVDAGGNGRGPTPVEALLAAIGGCTGMDVVAILRKMQTPPSALTITVDVDRATEHPKVLRAVRLSYTVEGGVPSESARRAIDLSVTKYCTVINSLSEDVEISWELQTGRT